MATTMSKLNKPLDASLKKLSISSTTKGSAGTKSRAAPESWEDEATSPSSPLTPTQADHDLPGPPPPTPISPSHHRRGHSTDWAAFTTSSANTKTHQREEKRPEKSAATASRMISGALGVKTKMTEEQKEYERAVRAKERKRIEGEKEEKRRKEKELEDAKRAIWDD